MPPKFTIITNEDWAIALRAARARRVGAKERQKKFRQNYENISKHKTPDIRSDLDAAPDLKPDKGLIIL